MALQAQLMRRFRGVEALLKFSPFEMDLLDQRNDIDQSGGVPVRHVGLGSSVRNLKSLIVFALGKAHKTEMAVCFRQFILICRLVKKPDGGPVKSLGCDKIAIQVGLDTALPGDGDCHSMNVVEGTGFFIGEFCKSFGRVRISALQVELTKAIEGIDPG